jgi:glycogen debranching enzyme
MSRLLPWVLLALALAPLAKAENTPVVPRFPLPASGLELRAPAEHTRFYDVVGRRSALFGYEGRPREVWVYPLKLVDEFELAFRLKDYPLEIQGRDVLARVEVRPESTTLVYAHSAFTVREILFAPLDEPGVVALLDVDSALPMTIVGTFRPRLRLMWPGGLMTPNLEWEERANRYVLSEESRRFAGVLGSPGARDLAVMPYQEEPKDLPVRFEIETSLESTRQGFVPIVFAGSITERDDAKSAYDRILASLPALYAATAEHYRRLSERTVSVATPDPALDRSFAWAKVGLDKGLATNPGLGTGLLAGYRTSGDSERPGFGWFFGRDALWSALALDAYGDFGSARAAIEFLRRVQREDGKVPHEISQSAPWLPWFTEYSYPWNSADASPLFVIAHADHWRATGDRAFLDQSFAAILEAWRFTAGTDTDGNGLVENTGFGHGWVEGGDLYPPHEEIYQQGVWIEACRSLAELAELRGDFALAGEARAWAERTRAALEKTYWLPERGFYGFATLRPRDKVEADRGPGRARRQARLEVLARGGLADEDTVMPAVPMWWGELDEPRAQSQLDHLGAAALATDWGARLLSQASELYDPLSYHHGSVWPLFTGWTAMAAYRYGRPHVGYQALLANADLRSRTALGYVTELLSGDYLAAFGRSSHHQVWSEAMVATPLLRGLLGLAVEEGGRSLRFAPQMPADWERVAVGRVPVAEGLIDLALVRGAGQDTITLERRSQGAGEWRALLAPAYPLDARIDGVLVNGRVAEFSIERVGDVQRPRLAVDGREGRSEVVIRYRPGTDVYWRHALPESGARSEGLRILRSRADASALRLLLEGRGGRTYALSARSPRRLASVHGVVVTPVGRGDFALEVAFEGPADAFVRREIVLPLE